jgi:hypothetical protein
LADLTIKIFMNKKPSFDTGVVAPILLGVFSLVGICVVLGAWLYKGERAPVPVPATATAFRYVYLGTEPGLSTLTPEVTDTPEMTDTPEVTNTPDVIDTVAPPPVLATSNLPDFILPSPVRTATVAGPVTQTPTKIAASTITPTIASVLSKVDDTYFQILYDGNWTAQSNVIGTHQNTLHISFTVGNAALFTFVGQQVIVSYQAGPSLGSININLDGSEVEVSQSSASTQLVDWRSPVLALGTHTLLIEHLSGGSVNLDSITIPDLSTPTPTATP